MQIANAASGWRLGGIIENREVGEYAYMYETLSNSFLDVHALQLRSSSTMPLSLSANVSCKRGDDTAERGRKFKLAAGSSVSLPVPIVGAHCLVTATANADEGGTLRLTLHYR